MNKIIILGCGYLGANLANYISKYYDEYVYVVGHKNGYYEYLNENVSFVNLPTQDINEKFKDIFENSICVDATGTTNATSSLETSEMLCLKNCAQKLNLIHMLRKLNIKEYVYLSSGGIVYGDSENRHREDEKIDPLNIYGMEKMFLEQFLKVNYIENHEFNYLILRVANPYGGVVLPNKKQGIIDVTIHKLLDGDPIDFYGDIDNVRDYIYIDDFSEAVYKLLLMGKMNDIYNVGTGIGYSIREVFTLIEKIYQKDIKLRICHSNKTVNIRNSVLNIEKLKRDTQFSPKISLEDGIARIIQHLLPDDNVQQKII